jgi:hypothetical protein
MANRPCDEECLGYRQDPWPGSHFFEGIDPAEYQRLKAESDEIKTKTGGKGAQAYTELKAQLDSLAGMVKQANDQLLAERQARANAERANAERTLQETKRE